MAAVLSNPIVRVNCWFWCSFLRLFRLIRSSVRLRRRFRRSAFAAVSPYHIIGLCLVLALVVSFGGGFVLSFRWFALGVGFWTSLLIDSEKARTHLWFALGVGFGRSFRR